MTRHLLTALLTATALLGTVSLANATEDISGKARVVDGDTIYVGSTKIRLFGIDAPEQKQTCTHKGKKWNCGQEATFALAYMTRPHWLECKEKDRDRYGRIVAVCFTGPYDVGKKMVRKGWALAYRKYSKDYVEDEGVAKRANVGMWRGEFMKPWEWRRLYRLKHFQN